MVAAPRHAAGRRALEDLVGSLGSGAHEFEPTGARGASPSLPGRTPGANLADRAARVVGADAILIDCGTSRRSGFTHVLWISPSAEAMLGSHVHERLGAIVGTVNGVSAYAWEGLDRLHVVATGMAWDDVLARARAAVTRALTAR